MWKERRWEPSHPTGRSDRSACSPRSRGTAGLACACVLVVAFSTGSSRAQQTGAEVLDVSLIQLIASPEKFEGRRVQLKGYCRFVFEEQSLYLHREDAELLNTANAVWIDSKGHEGMDRSFVRVEGTFTGAKHGHLRLWPGSLVQVTRLERARTRFDNQ
jgi:hypothetical protein